MAWHPFKRTSGGALVKDLAHRVEAVTVAI